MRRYFLYLFFCFLSTAVFAQEGKRSKPYVLPGFVQLNDSVFVSATEIDIRRYAGFMALREKLSDAPGFLDTILPVDIPLGRWFRTRSGDSLVSHTTQYGDGRGYDPENPGNYSRTTFLSYLAESPVVNVTREQALFYCAFKTLDYQNYISSNSRKAKRKRYPKELIFRLPTEAEWLQAVSSGLDPDLYKYGCLPADTIYCAPTCISTFPNGEVRPVSVYVGQQNTMKLLNTCGNAAEMLMDADFVMGGSYLDPVTECTVTSRRPYTGPAVDVGFRIVAVMRKPSITR